MSNPAKGERRRVSQEARVAAELLPVVAGEAILPGRVTSIQPGWIENQQAFQEADKHDRRLVAAPADYVRPGSVGMLVEILAVQRVRKHITVARVRGLERVRITSVPQRRPFVTAAFAHLATAGVLGPTGLQRLATLTVKAKEENSFFGPVPSEGLAARVDRLAQHLQLDASAKAAFIRAVSLEARLRVLEKGVSGNVEDRTMRLGRLVEEEDQDLNQGLPDYVKAAIQREGQLDTGSFSGRSRIAIAFLRDLKWEAPPPRAIELRVVKERLDASHAGLEEVKEAVLDHLVTLEWARRKGRSLSARSGTALCLIGPPGTGKTSIASTIAEVTGRTFERIPMGGVDDLFLVGADRAWTGSRPGEILRRLRNSGKHPSEVVFLLDEIDKLNHHPSRDPLPVLLALLDPTQNHAFRDQYLDSVAVDLSAALFVATANSEEAIPEPLKDRMRVIRLSGYTRDQQVAIGQEYILPKVMAKLDISDEVKLLPETIASLVFDYPRAGGLRQIEQSLMTLISRGLRCYMETRHRLVVRPENVREWLPKSSPGTTIGFYP